MAFPTERVKREREREREDVGHYKYLLDVGSSECVREE